MFTLGAFDAAATDGLTAILRTWNSLPAPEVQTVETPGVDGALYAETTLGQGAWTFDLYAIADTPDQVLAIAHQVAGALNPKKGLRPFTIDDPGWVWQAAAASPLEWARGLWHPGVQCQLLAEVTLVTPDPYAYAAPDETWQRTTPGGLTFTRQLGNAPSHPTIEVQATLTAAQKVTITIAGRSIDVTGPLTSSQVLRLDYHTLDFGVWQGAEKVASAVPRMSSYHRPELPAGEPVTTSVGTTGTLHQFRVAANSRRI